jgi:S-DNA-T family DNA segregation ATPase FtsK/SpoIIIE
MAKTKARVASPDVAEYGFIEMLRARRIALAPVYVGMPVLAVGIIGNLLLNGPQLLIGMAAVLLAAGVWIFSRVGQMWRRVYLGLITLSSVGWILWVSGYTDPRSWAWGMVVLIFGAVLFSIPHWVDRVKRTQVKMEDVVRNWPIRAGRIGLQNTDIVGVKMSEIGWTARLKWAPGTYLPDRIQKQEQEIEGALGLQRGELKVSFNGKANDSVILNVTLKDPHEQAILWDPETRELEDGNHELKITHGADAFTIGLRTDGTEKKLQIFKLGWGARQILIAGMKGSGKSGLLNRIWAHLALSDDVVQLGIDLKGGVELGPWRRVFHRVATSKGEAMSMMKMLTMLIDRRTKLMAKRGWKTWQGSPENPWVCVSVDEAASLLGSLGSKDLDNIADLFRKGRAAGVAFILATQFPTLEALGTSQIREQIDQGFCFRMSSTDGEGYVITAGVVHAEKIDSDRPGTCYHQDGDKLDPLPMRVTFVGDGENGTRNLIAELVSALAGTTPEMDEDSIRDGIDQLEWYANSAISLDDDETETGDGDDETGSETDEDDGETLSVPSQFITEGDVDFREVIQRSRREMTEEDRDRLDSEARAQQEAEKAARLNPEEARQAALDALREAGSNGILASELATTATRSSSWTYNLLDELEGQEQVKRTSAGAWAWCAEEAYAE